MKKKKNTYIMYYDFLTLLFGQTIGGSYEEYHLDHFDSFSFNLVQISINVHDWKYSQSISSGLQRSKIAVTFKIVHII